MKTIAQYTKDFTDSPEIYTPENVNKVLSHTLEKIKLLESIYMTGGALHHFSENFHNAAVNERQNLCQLSSACYTFLRENKIEVE